MNNNILEFTLDETKELFRQFKEDYKARGCEFTVDPRIIEDIHEQTDGYVTVFLGSLFVFLFS